MRRFCPICCKGIAFIFVAIVFADASNPARPPAGIVGISGASLVNGVVQWAAPLDLLVRSALARDIADRLPRGHVIIPGEVQPSGPAKVMVVTFAEFRISERGTVTLTAVWSLLNAATEKELTSQECTVHARAASATGGDIARAISVALGKLAEAMVVQITKPV